MNKFKIFFKFSSFAEPNQASIAQYPSSRTQYSLCDLYLFKLCLMRSEKICQVLREVSENNICSSFFCKVFRRLKRFRKSLNLLLSKKSLEINLHLE
ncbi:hypothetical protein BpHYR1_003509 [Brachionus plicatilis]|uniref:Uncharacterized protein n=1 Tax=Brachionus plicatilis TaxID=10195 RepID=A0A3M7T3R5_BRAPC|nr:hypothetical protein BpHYR1_003509 [Brachionus plicatilis]